MSASAKLVSSHTRLALTAVGIALLSAVFFTMTYVLNRLSANAGGHWAWTACLRYFATLPMLLPLMKWQGGISPVWRAIRRHPFAWLRASFIGFGLFYVSIAFAASSGPSWLIAGSFQFTVIAGMLCAPFIYKDDRRKLPLSAIVIAIFILAGVFLMQFGHYENQLDFPAWVALICVLVAAIAYPLGNRLLLLHLEESQESLNATQRVFGMTLASQPLWILVAIIAFWESGLPSQDQVLLASGVALSAGVIATILFFQATGMVKHHPVALGSAEAMQSAELIITITIGCFFLHEAWPQGIALAGSVVVTLGIAAFAWIAAQPTKPSLALTKKPLTAEQREVLQDS